MSTSKVRPVYFLLGSNVGNRKKNLTDALRLMQLHIAKIRKTSSIYETEPWGNKSLNTFLNCACVIFTSRSAPTLLQKIKAIEQILGRKIPATGSYQNRIIDIDILFAGNEVINTEWLKIPHPRFQERMFAIVPLMEIAPNLVNPISKISITNMYLSCQDPCQIRMI